uniref:Eukaryotic translation initiation factor 3 30 kDa subunit n=1 Tax=Pseudo-nitzschia delicatissima TaxID=44447 RepID=A0A7S0Y901_9STRA|mmetsp:Transcript_795/g.1619  ORF Transcript_795/g.1619 Transcript_795/m.1619 type:complete len:261 (+) Transcript_795:82-864(+)
MADNWDDSDDDDWDVDDDALDAKLGLNKTEEPANNFDDEEDLALKEKEEQERLDQVSLKKKGSALAAKKQAEKDRADDLEIARKALELEAEMEANLSLDERKLLERQRQEEAELEMMGDAFGGGVGDGGVGRGAQKAGDNVVMKDLKDHMKHARKVADCMKGHGKIHLASTFVKEVIQQSKDVLDDAAITEIIKACNVIKNEKVQQAKKAQKSKGQAQKSKKKEKAEQAKAQKITNEIFGDSNQYDAYDEYGEDYEDSFF